MLYLGMDLNREKPDIPAVDSKTAIKVLFFGEEIPVEPDATHIAVDANGVVHCYWAKPIRYKGDNEWLMGHGNIRVRYCGEVDLEGLDWRDTLREIKEYRVEP